MGCKNVPGGGGRWVCWGQLTVVAVDAVDDVLFIPSLAFNSSLHIGWPPPLLELSTSDTPLSAGLGGNEPEMKKSRINKMCFLLI